MMVEMALLKREFLRECRHRSHFIGRTAFVGGLVAVLLWMFVYQAGFASGRNVQSYVSTVGTRIFEVYAFVQYFALILFSTARAGALADERRIGTLPLLSITRLGDSGVIFATFASVMGRAAFTMLLALPVLVISRGLGGFTLEELAKVCVISLCAAAVAASLTLLVSSLLSSTVSAVAVSAVVQLAAGFVIVGFSPRRVAAWYSLNMIQLLLRGSGSWFAVIAFLLARVILVFTFLELAVSFLKRAPARPARPLKRLLAAADRFFLRLARNRFVLWRPGLGPCAGNPVLWRERAVALLGQRDHQIRIFYWAGAAWLLFAFIGLGVGGSRLVEHVFSIGLVLVPVFVLAVSLVVGPACAFARERQQRALWGLAVTPLSAQTVAWGKYLACLRMVLIPLALLSLAAACFVSVFGKGNLLGLALRYLVPVPLLCALILYVAAGAKNTTAAIISGAVALTGVLFILWYDGPFSQLLRGFRNPHIWSKPYASGLYLAPSIAFAFSAAILAKRSRLMRNAFFVALLIVGPLFLLYTMPYQEFGRTRPHRPLLLADALAVALVAAAFIPIAVLA
ncbi:MAG: hypothetical protein V2A58_00820, partial [Planctomycetota bacterium]